MGCLHVPLLLGRAAESQVAVPRPVVQLAQADVFSEVVVRNVVLHQAAVRAHPLQLAVIALRRHLI